MIFRALVTADVLELTGQDASSNNGVDEELVMVIMSVVFSQSYPAVLLAFNRIEYEPTVSNWQVEFCVFDDSVSLL